MSKNKLPSGFKLTEGKKELFYKKVGNQYINEDENDLTVLSSEEDGSIRGVIYDLNDKSLEELKGVDDLILRAKNALMLTTINIALAIIALISTVAHFCYHGDLLFSDSAWLMIFLIEGYVVFGLRKVSRNLRQ